MTVVGGGVCFSWQAAAIQNWFTTPTELRWSRWADYILLCLHPCLFTCVFTSQQSFPALSLAHALLPFLAHYRPSINEIMRVWSKKTHCFYKYVKAAHWQQLLFLYLNELWCCKHFLTCSDLNQSTVSSTPSPTLSPEACILLLQHIVTLPGCLCRMMYVQSLSLEACFQIHLQRRGKSLVMS